MLETSMLLIGFAVGWSLRQAILQWFPRVERFIR
jgi:hypothetical protein